MGGICRFAEQSAVFENYWADCFPHDWTVPTSLYLVIIPTDCSASLSQSYKHSESANLLRKLLLPHDWAVNKKTAAVSCKHGRLPSFSNLVSSSPALFYHIIPPMPAPAGAAGVSSLMFATTDSVVSKVEATLVAFCSALLVTFAGSRIPASIIST